MNLAYAIAQLLSSEYDPSCRITGPMLVFAVCNFFSNVKSYVTVVVWHFVFFLFEWSEGIYFTVHLQPLIQLCNELDTETPQTSDILDLLYGLIPRSIQRRQLNATL